MIRYAILYFVLLVVFIALMVGPVVAGKYLKLNINIPLDLLQPTGQNNNDTTTTVTGSCVQGACPGPGGGEAEETGSSEKLRRFLAY